MSLHITQSITTQQENRRRINTLGFHASVLSPRLSSLLHSLSLQAPLDKSTLCANKINLYIALIFFFFKLITTKMSKKKKKNGEKREKSLNLEIVFNFSVHFYTRAWSRRHLGLQSAAEALGQTFLSVCISMT